VWRAVRRALTYCLADPALPSLLSSLAPEVRGVWDFYKFRDFLPIYICHLSKPALSTRYCHFAPTWNRPVPRPPRLKIT
jgi:hypothetical protein